MAPAHFYLTASNSRGNEVRAGGQPDRQKCHLRGWLVGVELEAAIVGGKDEITVWMTGGSVQPQKRTLLGIVRLGEHGPYFIPEPQDV